MVESEVLKLNKEAMDRLRLNDTAAALSLLNKAQEILQVVNVENQVWGVTFNNLGCYFKKTEDFSTSLIHFKKALEIFNKKPNEFLSISGTLLNITSVYSELKNHEKALKSALKAYKVLTNCPEKSENINTSLVIAHHNIASEYEKLGKKNEALDFYKQGWELAKEKLGKFHQLTICMKKSAFGPMYGRNSSNFYQDKSKPRVLQFRSNSSNANSRVKFPKVSRKLITPTKDNYKNIKSVDKTRVGTVTVCDNQVNALNSLVKEIEKTLEIRPKKYVFKKKADGSELAELEAINKDKKHLPGISKFPNIFNNTADSPVPRNLQIIPELVNEDNFEANLKSVPKNRTYYKNF